MKLIKDFGITAWFGTLVLIGAFYLLGVGVSKGIVDFDKLLPLIGAWVSGIVTGYIVVKAKKQE